MSFAKLYSRALYGMNAPLVTVEVHVAGGLPSFTIVGLVDIEVRESRERVRSAIQNSGFDFPARRITVNLAPADLPKDSSRYDLPIALGILCASSMINVNKNLEEFEFAGELALDGVLRSVKGALAIAFGAKESSRTFILPKKGADEASLVSNLQILTADSLKTVVSFIENKTELERVISPQAVLNDEKYDDMADVKGQIVAKKAVEIAAAGRHSLLMIGNPGCGKSMLAKRIVSILPLLNEDEAIVSAALHSIGFQYFDYKKWRKVPFRKPHHSSSAAAIIGGGTNPRPGEVSLAHAGILFLDELPEFERKTLEMLREPLEDKVINIARVKMRVEYLANFQLIAAMNPCPCGNLGNKEIPCVCSPDKIKNYFSKISGPLLDRIDIVIDMPYLSTQELQGLDSGESSEMIAKRIVLARKIQTNRQGKLNSELTNNDVDKLCVLCNTGKKLLEQLVMKQKLSARGYYRLLKLIRTIADLDNSEIISPSHIAQANQYKHILK